MGRGRCWTPPVKRKRRFDPLLYGSGTEESRAERDMPYLEQIVQGVKSDGAACMTARHVEREQAQRG